MYYYCSDCGIIDEDDVYFKLIHEAVYYPNDRAQPAEYDEPVCPSCGNYVGEYVCDDCLTKGDKDDEILIIDEKQIITCHKCFIKKQAEEWLFDFHMNTVLNLISKFGFLDEKETHEYAWELIKEILKEKQS
jgi:NMD protein affecting ribosome stability and mRNA decay